MPEWWTDRIAPWVHYVPTQLDYSDVYDILTFVCAPMPLSAQSLTSSVPGRPLDRKRRRGAARAVDRDGGQGVGAHALAERGHDGLCVQAVPRVGAGDVAKQEQDGLCVLGGDGVGQGAVRRGVTGRRTFYGYVTGWR